jgi:hypothetical protein
LTHFSAASRRDTASGDYLDRGPDSCAPDFSAVVEFIIKRSEAHQLVALRGKHEIMMLDARERQRVLGDRQKETTNTANPAKPSGLSMHLIDV